MQPVLFTAPGLDWEVQAYGFFLGLALILGWAVSLGIARRDGLPAERLGLVYVLSAALSLFGARALWLVGHPAAFESWRSLATLQAGTLAPFAGVVIALVFSGFLVTRRKIDAWRWYDALAPAFALGVALESLGALLAGTAFGQYAPDATFSITFPEGSPAFAAHRAGLRNLMHPSATASLPVHPVQIYAALIGLAGFGLCVWVRRRQAFAGQVFLAFSGYYLIARLFLEEFLRADAAAPVAGPLNGGQLGALTLVAGIGVVYYTRDRIKRRRGRPVPAVPSRAAGSEAAAGPTSAAAKKPSAKKTSAKKSATKSKKKGRKKGKGKRS